MDEDKGNSEDKPSDARLLFIGLSSWQIRAVIVCSGDVSYLVGDISTSGNEETGKRA